MEHNDFPWAYPQIFIDILIQTDFKTIINARLACKSWNEWFNKNNIWIKYLKQRRNLSNLNDVGKVDMDKWYTDDPGRLKRMTEYRLNRLLLGSRLKDNKYTEADALAISSKMYKIQRQEELNLVPFVDMKVFKSAIKLTKGVEDDGIKSFGPVSAFIRLKVKSELITSIITALLNRRCYLSSIIRDKNIGHHSGQSLSKSIGQSFEFENFNLEDNKNSRVLNEGPEAQVYTSEAEWLAAEAAKSASKTAMTASNGLKRGVETMSDDDEPTSKKPKTHSSEMEKKEESIYSSGNPSPVNPNYPTILELLDIDNPVLEQSLKRNFSIDKILVIPRLDQILIQQTKTGVNLIPDDFEAIGSDCDGLVNKLKPSVDIKITDEATVYENEHVIPTDNGVGEREQIMFWGGIDIRNRWSTFADQLSQSEKQKIKKPGNKSNGLRSLNINVKAADLPESLPGLQAMLAARGVSLHDLL